MTYDRTMRNPTVRLRPPRRDETLRMFSTRRRAPARAPSRQEHTSTLLVCSLGHLLEPGVVSLAHLWGIRLSLDAQGATLEVPRSHESWAPRRTATTPPAWLTTLLTTARDRGAQVVRLERHGAAIPGLKHRGITDPERTHEP